MQLSRTIRLQDMASIEGKAGMTAKKIKDQATTSASKSNQVPGGLVMHLFQSMLVGRRYYVALR